MPARDLQSLRPSRVRTTIFQAGDLQALRQKLLVIAALRIALVTLAFGASLVLSHVESGGWAYWLIAAAYLVSVLYGLVLRIDGAILALAYVQIPVDSLLVTWLVLMTGGIDSVFNFVYVFVILGAAMTLYRSGALVATFSGLFLFGTIVLIQADNSLQLLPPTQGNAALSFFMYAIGLSLVGFLSSTLAETARSTGRRLAQKEIALERLEELHAAILRSLPAGLITVSPDGVVHYANEAAFTILRRSADDFLGKSLQELAPSIAEPWRNLTRLSRVPNPRERFEGNQIRPDGTTIRLGFSFAPLSLHPDEGAGLIVVFQDVTDIVRLKEAVERAERLATIGKFAAGLAHEVRNPLSSMCASIDVLNSVLAPPENLKRLMDNVVREADRLNLLIKDFLAFARPRQPELTATHVSALVSSFVEVFRADLKDVEIATALEPDLVASVDPDMLRQVLWNLARNASEAVPKPGGKLTISTRRTPDGVEIAVRDNGEGIPKDLQKRIFDPFFTTKPAGTGLGLAIAHSIMEAHGGRVLVSSDSAGTEFTLRFPTSGTPVRYDAAADRDPTLDVTPSNFEILGGPY